VRAFVRRGWKHAARLCRMRCLRCGPISRRAEGRATCGGILDPGNTRSIGRLLGAARRVRSGATRAKAQLGCANGCWPIPLGSQRYLPRRTVAGWSQQPDGYLPGSYRSRPPPSRIPAGSLPPSFRKSLGQRGGHRPDRGSRSCDLQAFAGEHCQMIGARVECDVGGIQKGSRCVHLCSRRVTKPTYDKRNRRNMRRTNPCQSSILYIGMGVHKESVTIAVLPSDARTPTRMERLPNDLVKLMRFLDRLASTAEIRACYEASGAGYVLQRAMQKWGYACDVIAPSLIPTKPGHQRKHDKHEAAQLARMYRAGELTTVRIRYLRLPGIPGASRVQARPARRIGSTDRSPRAHAGAGHCCHAPAVLSRSSGTWRNGACYGDRRLAPLLNTGRTDGLSRLGPAGKLNGRPGAKRLDHESWQPALPARTRAGCLELST